MCLCLWEPQTNKHIVLLRSLPSPASASFSAIVLISNLAVEWTKWLVKIVFLSTASWGLCSNVPSTGPAGGWVPSMCRVCLLGQHGWVEMYQFGMLNLSHYDNLTWQMFHSVQGIYLTFSFGEKTFGKEEATTKRKKTTTKNLWDDWTNILPHIQYRPIRLVEPRLSLVASSFHLN